MARTYADAVKGTKTRILDTRKTTPNMRVFEKYAVQLGGCTNHRFGLFDMVMLKDNHIDFAGGIENAIDKTRKYLADNNLDLKIEIETRNLEEVKRVLAHGKAYDVKYHKHHSCHQRVDGVECGSRDESRL